MYRSVHLILNPAAGNGHAGRHLGAVLQRLRIAGFTVQEYTTSRRMHAAEIAAALPDDGDPVCVAGGDGTLNEVLNGLRSDSHPIAVLPTGTGNDFAAQLGMRSVKDTINALVNDHSMVADAAHADVIDVEGTLLTRTFINAIGIGFDAAVAGDVAGSAAGRGLLPYLLAVFRVLRRYNAVHSMTTYHNTELSDSLFLACIGNGSRSGGGFRLTPKADITDGLLDLCHARELSLMRVMQVLPRALRGTHLSAPEVSYIQAAHFRVALDTPLPVHVDGEILSERALRVVVTCRPAAQRFFTAM
ncbi:MAG: diacylglycerol kinase family lipid kinase [Bacteroidetes bacterium]|nr:diacylglycerol kinase family lipid kinase [Bacteroidota bacterium]